MDGRLKRTEVNVSNRQRGFQIQCFTDSADESSKCLTIGTPIRLLHSEAEAVLNASANRNPDAWELNDESQGAKDYPEEYMKRPYLFCRKRNKDYPIFHKENLSAKSIFVIEGLDVTSGGTVKWGGVDKAPVPSGKKNGPDMNANNKYRLRHVGSGRYLGVGGEVDLPEQTERVLGSQASEKETALAGAEYYVKMVNAVDSTDPSYASTIFKFVSGLPEGTKRKENNNALPLTSLVAWLSHELEDGTRVYLHNSGRVKRAKKRTFKMQNSVNLCAVFSSVRLDEDTLQMLPCGNEEMKDVNTILSWIPHAEKYCKLLQPDPYDDASASDTEESGKEKRRKKKKSKADGPFDQEFARGGDARMGPLVTQKDVLTGIAQMVVSTCFFTLRYPEYEDGLDADIMKPAEYLSLYASASTCTRMPDPIRQHRCRQLKVIDHMFQMIAAPEIGGYDLDAIGFRDECTALKRIHKLLYKSLRDMFYRNPQSELYIATRGFQEFSPRHEIHHTYMRAAIQQLGHDLGNTDMLATLVDRNKFILQKCLQPDDLETFVQLIHAEGPADGRYLRFLNATLVCGDEPIYEQQVRVLELLYSVNPNEHTVRNRKSALCETAIDHGGHNKIPVGFSKADSVPYGDSKVLEGGVVQDGLECLVISWESSPTFEMGKDDPSLYFTPESMDLPSKDIAELPKNYERYLERIEEFCVDLDGNKIEKEAHDCVRTWVPLEEIMWTLDPEELFSKVFPDHTMTYEQFKEHTFGQKSKSAAVVNEAASGTLSENPAEGAQKIDAEPVEITAREQKVAWRKFLAVKCMADAYVAQITMFANLCQGRNYRCIRPLSRQFSFKICLTGIAHPKYPSELKAAFSNLLMTLWVDRIPHDKLPLPNLVRMKGEAPEIENDQELMIPVYELSEDSPLLKNKQAKKQDFFKCLDHNKFWVLEQIIMKNLDDTQGMFIAEMEHRNAFTLSMLKILKLLCEFGFVRSIPKVQKIANKILLSLDGRDDVATCEEYGNIMQAADGSEDGLAHLFKAFSYNPLSKITDTVVDLTHIRLDDQSDDNSAPRSIRRSMRGLSNRLVSGVLGDGEDEPVDDPNEQFFSTVPQFQDEEVKSLPRTLKDILEFYGREGTDESRQKIETVNTEIRNAEQRYKANAEGRTIGEAKEELLAIVFQFELAVIDVMISQVMYELEEGPPLFEHAEVHDLKGASLSEFWKEKYSNAGPQIFLTNHGLAMFRSLIRGSRAKINRLVSLSASSTVPVVTTFLDLLMYEDSEACEGGLKGLNWQFSFTDRLMKYMEKVHLIEDAEDQRKFRRMSMLVQELSMRVNSFSSWGIVEEGEKVDQEVLDSVLATMEELIHFCQEEKDDDDDDGMEHTLQSILDPDRGNQTMLRQLDLHEVILRALESIEIPEDDPRGVAWNIHCAMNKMISAFVRQNETNQEIIFEGAIETLMESIGLATGGASTLTSLFGDNAHLCTSQEVKTLTWMMGSRLSKTERTPDKIPNAKYALEFFAEIACPGGKPQRANQDNVMDMLGEFRSLLKERLFDKGNRAASRGLTEQDKGRVQTYMKKLKSENANISSDDRKAARARKTCELEINKIWSGEGYRALKELSKNFDPAAATAVREKSDFTNERGIATCQLEYHIKLTELVGSLSKGMHTRNEMKVQQMFPLKRVLATLLDDEIRENCFELKVAYLKLFIEAYLETELEPQKPIIKEEALWWFFENAATELEVVSMDIDTYMKGSLFDYVFNGLLAAFLAYFDFVHNPEELYTRGQEDIMNKITDHVKDIYELEEVREHPKCAFILQELMRAMGIPIKNDDGSQLMRRASAIKLDDDKSDIEKLVTGMNNDPRFTALIREEIEGAVKTFVNADMLTNPYDPKYLAAKETNSEASQADQRTNVITFKQIMSRITRHIDNNPFSDACTDILELLANIIDFYLPQDNIRDPVTFVLEEQDFEGTEAVLNKQKEIYKSFQIQMDKYGVTELAVDMIAQSCPTPGYETVDEDRRAINAYKLLIAVMEGGNRVIQDSFTEYLHSHPAIAEDFFKKISQRLERDRKDVAEVQRERALEEAEAEKLGTTLLYVMHHAFIPFPSFCRPPPRTTIANSPKWANCPPLVVGRPRLT
jgi:hypothetical protein